MDEQALLHAMFRYVLNRQDGQNSCMVDGRVLGHLLTSAGQIHDQLGVIRTIS